MEGRDGGGERGFVETFISMETGFPVHRAFGYISGERERNRHMNWHGVGGIVPSLRDDVTVRVVTLLQLSRH